MNEVSKHWELFLFLLRQLTPRNFLGERGNLTPHSSRNILWPNQYRCVFVAVTKLESSHLILQMSSKLVATLVHSPRISFNLSEHEEISPWIFSNTFSILSVVFSKDSLSASFWSSSFPRHSPRASLRSTMWKKSATGTTYNRNRGKFLSFSANRKSPPWPRHCPVWAVCTAASWGWHQKHEDKRQPGIINTTVWLTKASDIVLWLCHWLTGWFF